jgi:hypothetical protein
MKKILTSKAPAMPLRLAVAQVGLGFAPKELARALKRKHLIAKDLGVLRKEVVEILTKTRAFSKVRSLPKASSRADALLNAWQAHDDLVLFLTLKRFENSWEGSNGWFLPNLLLWATFIFPSYWIADECFGAAVELEMELVSVHSQKTVARKTLSASTVRDLDDFDRGWQPLGILRVPGSLDEENWEKISEVVSPYPLTEVKVGIAAWFAESFRGETAKPAFPAAMEKTLALVIGLSKHDTYALHNIRYASRDAQTFWDALTEKGGLAPRNGEFLLDERATAENIRNAVTEFLLPRAREHDTVLIYFAGYGGFGPGKKGGEPYLLPYDFDHRRPMGETALSLGWLQNELEKCAARHVVVMLDTSFNGARENRSYASETPSGVASVFEGFFAKRPGGAFFAGAGPLETALEFEDKSMGLFSFYMAEGLAGKGDRNRDGAVTLEEIAAYVTSRVEKRSLMHGGSQRPVLFANKAADAVLARPGVPKN